MKEQIQVRLFYRRQWKLKKEIHRKSCSRRVMEQAEWKILPKAIDLIANGKVKVEDGRTDIISARIIEIIDDRRCQIGGKNMKVLIVGSGGREHAIAWKCCTRVRR